MTDIDSGIFAGIVKGDRKAFENLFQKYYGILCDYAFSYLNDVNEIEDTVQDVFVYVWNNREAIHVNSSVRSYLFTSVKHRALNILK
ncbi:MAG: RNA polymerase sigma-70 factor, partial [Odoribacter sp.]|nr:RNA polymerase sigma-70 factor [Odoribacter sp.]